MSKLSRLSSLLSLLLCAAAPVFAQAPPVTTVATGLSDPRGLAFTRNGDLYVAEAWTAPGTLTTTNCFQSVIGPFTGGFTSRISRVRRGSTTPEVVADGETGFLVEPGDAAALAGAISRFFDEGRAAAFGAAVAVEKRKYSWERMAAAIEELAAT